MLGDPSAARPFDVAIFDLDGTLVDSAPDIARALNATLVEAGHRPLAMPEVLTKVGEGARVLLELSLPASAEAGEVSRLLERFIGHYASHICDDTRPYDGIVSLLERLRAAGLKTAVLTNKIGPLARQLVEGVALSAHFDRVVGDGDGYPRKPDPTAARALITELGATPARAVMIGDGVPDLRVARAVPCASIAAAWGYAPAARLAAESPSFTAATPDEVAAIVLRPQDPH